MLSRTWHPFHITDDGLGLVTRQREDQVAPNVAVVSRNIDYSDRTIQKRPGFRRFLKGDLDAVLKGGAPGTSIVWHGDERKKSDPQALFYTASERHWRQGVGVLPEFDITDLRLNVRPADNQWVLETCFHSDDIYTGPHSAVGGPGYTPSRTKTNLPIVIASKGEGTAYQWKVLIKPEATENLNATQPYVVLRIRDNTAGTDNDFYYNPAGSPGSFVTVGKRYWFAWKFDGANIISYYWKEGDTFAASTTQAVPGALAANGVGAGTYAAIFGGVSRRAVATGPTERNFNGSTPEVRFWSSGAASAVSHPDWTNPATAYYFEKEIPADKINANGTWADANYNHLILYLAFTGDQISSTDPRLLLPRAGKNSGGIDFTKNKVWLTGADATWIAATDGASTRALTFCPAGASPRQGDYMRAIVPASGAAELFGCGIRVPGGNRYWQKLQSATPAIGGQVYHYTFNDGLGVQVRYRPRGLESGMVDQVLFELGALNGPSFPTTSPFKVYVRNSGGNARIAMTYQMTLTSTGLPTTQTITGTTNLVEGTWYTVTATVQYIAAATDFFARVELYLDTNLEGSFDPNSVPDTVKKPFASWDNNLDTTAPNRNDKDDRGEVMTASIGCSCDSFLVGGSTTVGAIVGGNRPADSAFYPWGYQDNKCKFTADDGVFGRSKNLFIGDISRVAVFGRWLSRTDVDRWSSRAPTPAEVATEGSALLSLWRMQEGKGGIVFDSGSLGNHLRIMPYPRARIRSGPIYRRNRSPITGAWEFRTRTPREGVSGRDIYALAGGSLLRTVKDGSGDRYLEPLANGILCEQRPQPTAFQFQDFTFICPGEGPVLRVSRSKVVPGGLSPVAGGIQAFDLGFVEAERDGTFFVTDQFGAVATGPFEGAKTYQYLITYYDAENAIESAASRIRSFTIEKATAGQTLTFMRLMSFPVPPDRAATHYRIYRTAADGDTFRFVDQIPVGSVSYDDRKADDELTGQFNAALNYPPPLNCRIGIATGSRAFYTGNDDQPGTFWWSKAGFPELVPPAYQATLTSSRSNRITGLSWQHDRILVFLQDATLVAYDVGGDAGIGQLVGSPIQFGVVREGIGCVEHHTIVDIPGIGAVFAGEKGVYVTDGSAFQCVSDEIQPTYELLDRTTYGKWHARHLRSRNLYLLFCRTTDTSLVKESIAGRNNFALAYNYVTGKWSTWTDIPAAWSTVIEDETDGLNRLIFSDYLGELFELAPDDDVVENDGVGADLVTANLSGSVISTTSATKVQLFGSNTLPTDGDGLRGVLFQCNSGAAGAIEYRRIIENDGQYVTLESALTNTPTSANTWKLAAIASEWRGGMWDMGLPGDPKKISHAELNLGADGEGSFSAELRFMAEALGVAGNIWSVPATSARYRVGPKINRGERAQVRLYDDAPNNRWEVTDIEVGFWPERSPRWRS